MTLSPLFETPPAWIDDDNDILRAQFERLAKATVAWSQRMTAPIFEESNDADEESMDDEIGQDDPENIAADSRLGKLIHRFQLSALERDILLLSLLPEYDILYGELYARTQPVSTGLRPCVATLMGILCPDWSTRAQIHTCFLAQSRLMHSGLLALQQKEHATLAEAVVLADNALYLWLLGHEALPSELTPYARWFQAPVLPDLSPDLTEKLLQCCLESEAASVVAADRPAGAGTAGNPAGHLRPSYGDGVLQRTERGAAAGEGA